MQTLMYLNLQEILNAAKYLSTGYDSKDLLKSMLKAALIPVIIDLHQEPSPTQNFSRKDIEVAQLLALFSEYSSAAQEYHHYCQSKKIYQDVSALEKDTICLERVMGNTSPKKHLIDEATALLENRSALLKNEKIKVFIEKINTLVNSFHFTHQGPIDVLLAYKAITQLSGEKTILPIVEVAGFNPAVVYNESFQEKL